MFCIQIKRNLITLFISKLLKKIIIRYLRKIMRIDSIGITLKCFPRNFSFEFEKRLKKKQKYTELETKIFYPKFILNDKS